VQKVEILGYQVSAAGLEHDVAECFRLMKGGGTGRYAACANPHSLVLASRDGQFRDSLAHADLLLPDGIGVVLASRLLKTPVKEKVAGYDFFTAITQLAQLSGGIRYFFLGSSREVLDLIRDRLAREYPSVDVCGVYAPPFADVFSEEQDQEMVEAVNQAAPDALWVGMTAPKQEKWIYRNHDRLEVPFIGAIGAVFDFLAGTKHRPSTFWQHLGLEWLLRFLAEPARLYQRNLESAPLFAWWIMREKLRALAAREGSSKK
jgi:N-acetylglucosaminyldiphosphoundecaprenol N-acetyl-beta-D-mannosaminyltransferase